MKILVFESSNEVIIGDLDKVEELVETWFNNTDRSLEDFETYTIDGSDGLNILLKAGQDIRYEIPFEFVEAREMISTRLRVELNKRGALDDIEEELDAYEGPIAA